MGTLRHRESWPALQGKTDFFSWLHVHITRRHKAKFDFQKDRCVIATLGLWVWNQPIYEENVKIFQADFIFPNGVSKLKKFFDTPFGKRKSAWNIFLPRNIFLLRNLFEWAQIWYHWNIREIYVSLHDCSKQNSTFHNNYISHRSSYRTECILYQSWVVK